MSNAAITVNFGASTDNLQAGISSVRDALAGLSGPISEINSKYAALGTMLVDAHAHALQSIRANDESAYGEAVQAAEEAISEQIRAEQDGLREKLGTYADDARNYRLSEQEKIQASREEIQTTYDMEFTLLNKKKSLLSDSIADRQQINNRISQLERQEQSQLALLSRETLDEQSRYYFAFFESISGAFNAQIHGLLSGTETWREAFRRTLAELVVRFIEFSDQTVVQWMSSELSRTAATESGTAARTSIQQAGAAASLASQSATAIRSILSSAAEAFAGVFGFLAPIMGPLAAGPAAAAQATVASAVGAVTSADIGIWNVPSDMLTLVHQNEMIMPAAEAGALREILVGSASGGDSRNSNVSISPSTHFHINALDSGSVSQWLRSNAPEMLRSISDSIRQGAHLGLSSTLYKI